MSAVPSNEPNSCKMVPEGEASTTRPWTRLPGVMASTDIEPRNYGKFSMEAHNHNSAHKPCSDMCRFLLD
jgi:hypothetical protein